ncbi:AraC family transcriptional regulator [Heyndrickxia shackletonii]|uniref:AraC family transcriptional regulator n=1 Tax=Heyndrickxia shackletonii TaxID=157838 RepID=A0A0Q3WUY1_9BACI|nr:AraC family transcriptional regulator [Heyndrickxia shackletonii]KQL52890.1 AraC family transcriptional regulator [Heyndrickxia shackletonii]NEY98932.1 AraC family transcriptional regulator [Heyndrickxia shackletonii]
MSNVIVEIPQSHRDHLPVKILYVTKAKYDKDWHSTNHTHPFTEILYITKGKGTFVFSNKEVPVTEHDLIVINPNIEHTEKSSPKDPLEYIALGIQGIAFLDPNNSGSQITFYNFKQEQHVYLFYLRQLLEEVQNQKEDYEIIIHNILEILLLKMMRKREFTLEKTSAQKINKDIAFIKNYIKLNFRENINLDTLAEAGHINKYYLAHSFKKLVGVSPIEYLIQTRIRESKILLETTNYPISNIAAITGFSSQSFFAQSFKRVTNLSPSQYRNLKSAKNNKTKRAKRK